VVTDLQQVCAEALASQPKKPRLGRVLRVADEQRDRGPQRDAEHERGVVRDAERVGLGAWTQHVDGGLAEAARPATQRGGAQHRDPSCSQRGEQHVRRRVLVVARLEPALPELTDLDVRQERAQPEVMIGVRMGEHDHVDPRAPARGELRAEHPAPDIDGRAHDAAAVDEHRAAIREIDEQRVALTYVKHRDPELARGRPSRAGHPLGGAEGKHGEGEHGSAAALPEPKREGADGKDGELGIGGRWERQLRAWGFSRGERDGAHEPQRAGDEPAEVPLDGREPPGRRVEQRGRQRHELGDRRREEIGRDAVDGQAPAEAEHEGRRRERRSRGGHDARVELALDRRGLGRRPTGDTEERARRQKRQGERPVRRGQRIDRGMNQEGEAEAPRRSRPSTERPREQRHREHRGGPPRGPTAPRKVGMEDGERQADAGGDGSHVGAADEPLHTPQQQPEQAHHGPDRNDEVPARDRQEVREAARLEGVTLGVLEVGLAEHQGPSERRRIRCDGRLDAAANVRPGMIDRAAWSRGTCLHRDVEDTPT